MRRRGVSIEIQDREDGEHEMERGNKFLFPSAPLSPFPSHTHTMIVIHDLAIHPDTDERCTKRDFASSQPRCPTRQLAQIGPCLPCLYLHKAVILYEISSFSLSCLDLFSLSLSHTLSISLFFFPPTSFLQTHQPHAVHQGREPARACFHQSCRLL